MKLTDFGKHWLDATADRPETLIHPIEREEEIDPFFSPVVAKAIGVAACVTIGGVVIFTLYHICRVLF